MNKINRATVNKYILKENKDKLYFNKQFQDVFHTIGKSNINLRKLVITALMLSKISPSYTKNKTGKYSGFVQQTSADRNRSVLDIWRHIKSVRAKVSIFDVMHALYYITTGNAFTIEMQFCFLVQRRVFYLIDIDYDTNFYDEEDEDEFGLMFSSWRSI